MTAATLLAVFMTGTIAGAWAILSLLALRPQIAEAWRRRR